MATDCSFSQFVQFLESATAPILSFDIETGPELNQHVQKVYSPKSLKMPKAPGVFDPKSVKVGNLKDPVKIQDKITEAELAHNSAKEKWLEDCKQQAADNYNEFYASAPLHASRGRIFSIGYACLDLSEEVKESIDSGYFPNNVLLENQEHILLDMPHLPMQEPDEQLMLQRFAAIRAICQKKRVTMVGHNIIAFDIPFLVRRAFVNRMARWPKAFDRYGRIDERFAKVFDTLAEWKMTHSGDSEALQILATILGVPGKLPGMDGSEFWKLWYDNDQRCNEYLTRDVVCSLSVALAMGAHR